MNLCVVLFLFSSVISPASSLSPLYQYGILMRYICASINGALSATIVNMDAYSAICSLQVRVRRTCMPRNKNQQLFFVYFVCRTLSLDCEGPGKRNVLCNFYKWFPFAFVFPLFLVLRCALLAFFRAQRTRLEIRSAEIRWRTAVGW